ncbi:MAG: hypothetical protein H6Q89_2465 [Myxococcaceae bacterium]|nr:hypothetical protein [Myxococcaceae bacterium]
MTPMNARMREAFNTLEQHIERRYGIPVRIRDVPNPFTGDLDGTEIHVDHDEDIESALFIIAHLFGHTVQWNTSEASREIGYKLYPNPSEEMIKKLHDYEYEACRYSMQLFHEAGVHDLDQWLSDYSACDFAYLLDFYRTNQKKPFKSFWKNGAPLLTPRPIPEFHPTKWVARGEGIVV